MSFSPLSLLPLPFPSLLFLLLLLPHSALSQSCGAFSIDLTPLSVPTPPTPPTRDLDLTFSNGAYWYGLHPCGTVDEVFCGGESSAAMLCQYQRPLSFYRPDEVTWLPYANNRTGETGLTMHTANGVECQGAPVVADVHFVCDAGVVEGQLTEVVQDAACHYTAHVRSRYACEGVVGGETAASAAGLGTGGKIGMAVGATVAAVLLCVGLAVLGQRWWRAGKTWPRDNQLLAETASEMSKTAVEMQSTYVGPDTAAEKV